jgi:arylsulfatase A-like enzyme
MDRLATEGVWVDGACTPSPSTGPAHVSLFTGLHPWNHRALLNAVPFHDPTLPNLAARLHEAGLATAAFVSSYVVDARWGFGRGFESFHFEPTRKYPFSGRLIGFWSRGEATTDAVIEWLEANASRPFFVWVHYFDPHDPYRPPAGHARPEDEVIDLQGKSLPPGISSEAGLKDEIRRYRGEVSYTDAQVGRLLDALERTGLDRRTAVILTADHGEGLGDHGHLRHGRNLFDELVLVPLLIRSPGIPARGRLSGAAQLEDLMPTVLSLLGVGVPEGLDGRDLTPWLRGELDASPREAVLGSRAPYARQPSIYFQRRRTRKWIGELDEGGLEFDLRDDPREAGPAPDAPPPPLLEASVPEGGSVGRERVLDAESRRALEALGYLQPGSEADAEQEAPPTR